MIYSRQLLNFTKLVLRERYRDPTLQLVIPTLLVGNIFIPVFLADDQFKVYALALSMIPVLNTAETLTFALVLRNVIFVFGDHIYTNSVVSFLMLPVSRRSYFLTSLLSDVGIPYVLWLLTTLLYLWGSGTLNVISELAILSFTVGLLFSSSILFLLVMSLRNPGTVTISSLLLLGGIFGFGGLGVYYLAISVHNLWITGLAGIMNPFILDLGYGATFKLEFIYELVIALIAESLLSILILSFAYRMFREMET
ncbi:hypothetical protein HS7_11230 [Sulfolobales archaeon HS-7]|nr:hypothetical protein HS7_11230 [Sulfolobales archaeon HS-7]